MEQTRNHPNTTPIKKEDDPYIHNLLHPKAVQYAYAHEEESWFQKLNELGEHWIPNPRPNETLKSSDLDEFGFELHPDPKDNPLWHTQLGQAWLLTYRGLWSNGTKYLMHQADPDAVINKAMRYLMTDLRNYDPKRGLLGHTISAQIKKRIFDATRQFHKVNNRDDFHGQLQHIQTLWMEHSHLASTYKDEVVDLVLDHYGTQINTRFRNHGGKEQANASLLDHLEAFDPMEDGLVNWIGQWVAEELGGEQKQTQTVSVNTENPDDEKPCEMQLGTPKDALEEQVENRVLGNRALELMAQSLNFQALQDANCLQNPDHRADRMCYTEKILGLLRNDLPLSFNQQDLHRALLDSYLRFFLWMPEGNAPVNLVTVPVKTMEQIENPHMPEQAEGTPLEWNSSYFLPAKVPIHYLDQQFHCSASNKNISDFRKAFTEKINRFVGLPTPNKK